MNNSTEQHVSTIKYAIHFFGIVTFGTIITFLIFILFDSNATSLVTFIPLIIGGSQFASTKFIKDYQRLPNKKEKINLTIQCAVAAWFISFLSLLIPMTFLSDILNITGTQTLLKNLEKPWALLGLLAIHLVLIPLIYSMINSRKLEANTISKKNNETSV